MGLNVVDYFLQGNFESDLNFTNPLGLKGELASSYAKLLEKIWTSKTQSAVSPKDLKKTIGKQQTTKHVHLLQ